MTPSARKCWQVSGLLRIENRWLWIKYKLMLLLFIIIIIIIVFRFGLGYSTAHLHKIHIKETTGISYLLGFLKSLLLEYL